MSRIENENFICIQGWMINELNLKGNELLIYACIYGFSQAEKQSFTGSLQYLADWTNSTKQGVLKALKSLEEKGFIQKKENYINGVKFCEYSSMVLNKVEYPIKQSLTGGIKQSLPNNIDNNNIEDKYKEIFDHWNSKSIIKHSVLNDTILKAIKQSLKEFSLEQIKLYIDRYAQVINNKDYFFNTKWTLAEFLKQKNAMRDFSDEGSKWLNYISFKAKSKTFKAREYTEEELNGLYDNVENLDL